MTRMFLVARLKSDPGIHRPDVEALDCQRGNSGRNYSSDL